MANGRIQSESPAFIKAFEKLTKGKFQSWEVWQDFIVLAACTFSNSVDWSQEHRPTRMTMYSDRIQKYSPEEQAVFPELLGELINAMEKNQEQDFLGHIFMQLELSSHWKGQFFTPYSVCRMMGDMTVDKSLEQIQEKGYITINDPACGAGATLIAFLNAVSDELYQKGSKLNWQNHILVTAQDIDTTVGLMCYIQMSLMGAAGWVKIGNTLTDPARPGDNKECYWYTPMYFHEVWHTRRLVRTMDDFLEALSAPEKESA